MEDLDTIVQVSGSLLLRNFQEPDFFVIVYDPRGEGRSEDKNGKYTFKESFDDLIDI
jgi:proline iminopeptidase